jgi:TPR repeat protein
LRFAHGAARSQTTPIFDQAEVGSGILDWCEKANPALFSAFKVFQQLASKSYGKAFYPLSVLCGGQDISTFLEQDEARLRRHPIGTQYWGQQAREIIRRRPQFQSYAQLAFLWCIANQSNDDAELWCDLGKMYLHGYGVEKNVERAVFWHRKAAEQGYVKAQNVIAQWYIEGHGVPVDYHLAMSWFQKAAKQGDSKAQYEIGVLYSLGWGVLEDDAEAASWYQKAAEQGFAQGQWQLGEMYSKGRGVEKDNTQAEYWYRKAAENNDDPEWDYKYSLGEMYRKGDGVAQNDEQAVYWFRKAADRGNSDAREALRKFGIDWNK